VLVKAWVCPAFPEGIKDQLFDLRLVWFSSRGPARKIAIVVIGDESITRLGCRPWPRSRLAATGEIAVGVGRIDQPPDADGVGGREPCWSSAGITSPRITPWE